MRLLNLLTSGGPGPALRLTASVLATSCSYALAADAETSVVQVSLTVDDGAAKRSSAGLLFRVTGDTRKHVADIGENGKPDQLVKCVASEKFEAQAESNLDRPVAPVRIACSKMLAFTFTRMFVTMVPPDMANPLADSEASPKAFARYAEAFKFAGKHAEAATWSDAAKIATAKSLGDTKLDKYVARDISKNFELKFTPSGIAALKNKQAALGVPVTGELDTATQDALAKGAKTKEVGALACRLKAKRFVCGPQGTYQAMNEVRLPKLSF